MSARGLLRLGLAAGLLASSVSTAEAGKAKDARFVNPRNPEGKVRAVTASKGLARNVRSAPTLRGNAASNAANYAPPNSPSRPSYASSGGSRFGGDRSGGSRNYASTNRASSGYRSNNKPYYRNNSHYDSHHSSHSSVSIGIGVGCSSYGSYVGGSYYSSPSYCSYPSYSYGYSSPSRCYYPYSRWGYGWNCAPYGWSSSYYCPVTPVCAPASTVVVYAGGSCVSGGGTYYSTACQPLVYSSTAYEVQAEPAVVAYHDWQESAGSTSGIDAVVLPAPRAGSPSDSAQQWTPSGRQIEAVRQGWTLVAQDKARDAVAIFAAECELDGRHAPAKVGYSVASALAGEGAAARWGMRRAFATPSQSLAYLPSVAGLTGILNGLSGSMWRELAGRPATADDWFLLASIDYLRHDLGSARRAAQEAADLGDDTPSLLNLRAQIQAEAGG